MCESRSGELAYDVVVFVGVPLFAVASSVYVMFSVFMWTVITVLDFVQSVIGG